MEFALIKNRKSIVKHLSDHEKSNQSVVIDNNNHANLSVISIQSNVREISNHSDVSETFDQSDVSEVCDDSDINNVIATNENVTMSASINDSVISDSCEIGNLDTTTQYTCNFDDSMTQSPDIF